MVVWQDTRRSALGMACERTALGQAAVPPRAVVPEPLKLSDRIGEQIQSHGETVGQKLRDAFAERTVRFAERQAQIHVATRMRPARSP